MSTPSTKYPAPSAEERAIQATQLAQLQRSEEQNKLWEPILTSEMGYKESIDPETGEKSLAQMSEEEILAGMSADERNAYQVQKLASEREISALRGELPVDPAVERDISGQRQELQERLGKQLGTGWETSTAGIQALSAQKQRELEMRDAVRRGEMTTSEAVAESRSGQLQQLQQQLLQGSGANQQRALDLTTAYETPKSWLSNLREQKFQSKLAHANLEAQKMGQISGSMQGCCWTFCATHGEIPEEVRLYRDLKHPKSSNVAIGYTWMSSWLVPLMEKHPKLTKWVKRLMTEPMTKYAKWYYGKNSYGWIFYLPSLFFGTAWNIAGWAIKPLFENKELVDALSARSRSAYQN